MEGGGQRGSTEAEPVLQGTPARADVPALLEGVPAKEDSMRALIPSLVRSRSVIILASPLFLSGCASTGGSADLTSPFEAPASGTPCTLVVENHGWSDLHLYALRLDGTRLPLGTVGSLDRRTVRFPKTLMAARQIRLLAVPAVLGEAYVTDTVMLEGGTTLQWHLKNELPLSTLVVR